MINSIAGQLYKIDYLTVIFDEPANVDIQTEATVIKIYNTDPMGYWGHGSRTFWQKYLPGDYLINGDDDDVFLPDAMTSIRENCQEDKLYIFKMKNNHDYCVPTKQEIYYGNIGTPCGVYMNHDLPDWEPEFGGDYKFYKALSQTRPVQFVDKIIYHIRP